MSSNRIKGCLLVTFLLVTGGFCGAADVEIELLNEATIDSDIIRVGDIGLVRGEESLIDTACDVTLSRILLPGQEVTIDRPTILSRLASNGIPASSVTITGADQVTVKQRSRVISGEEFIEKALEFLRGNPAGSQRHVLQPVGAPFDLMVAGPAEDIKLAAFPTEGSGRNRARVLVKAFSGDTEIGRRIVSFRLMYKCRRAVAITDIAAGRVINAQNVSIETTMGQNHERSDWSGLAGEQTAGQVTNPPYGFVARRWISAGSALRPGMVQLPEAPVIVERNQMVTISVERPGLVVTALGKAMEDGRVGEYIKVQNVDSRRKILVRVKEDGTVEPIF